MRRPALVPAVAALALSALVTACESPPIRQEPAAYRAVALDSVRRVLVLPFVAECDYPDQAEMVSARFVEAIRGGPFTVLPLPEASFADELVESVRMRGVVRADDLVRLERDYRVDGVVLGAVTRFDPYAPQVIGLDAKMISTRTGEVLWACRESFDASRDEVSADALAWYDVYVERTGAEFGPEVVLLSPRAFARYACARLAESIARETRLASR